MHRKFLPLGMRTLWLLQKPQETHKLAAITLGSGRSASHISHDAHGGEYMFTKFGVKVLIVKKRLTLYPRAF
jgi:hypothetical protein